MLNYKTIWLYLVVAIAFLTSFSCDAEPNGQQCVGSDYVLVFNNGMFNSRKDARKSLNAIREKTKIDFVYWTVAYNTNEPFIEQMLQVYKQRSDDTDHFLWSYLSRLDGPRWFTQLAIKKMSQIDYSELENDRDLQGQVEKYRKLLATDLGVVAVAHSQGNFYINTVEDTIRWSNDYYDLEDLNVVSVANPAHDTFGKYITLKSDGVIRAIPYAMPANFSNNDSGLFDHQFIKNNLDGVPSGRRIVEMIINVVNSDVVPDGGPDFQRSGVVDESLRPMRLWLERLRFAAPERFTPVECLAVAFFLRAASDSSCESFETAAKNAHFCYDHEWSKKRPDPWYPACSLPGFEKETPYAYVYPSDEYILYDHKECDTWRQRDVYKRMTPELIKKALDFVAHPADQKKSFGMSG